MSDYNKAATDISLGNSDDDGTSGEILSEMYSFRDDASSSRSDRAVYRYKESTADVLSDDDLTDDDSSSDGDLFEIHYAHRDEDWSDPLDGPVDYPEVDIGNISLDVRSIVAKSVDRMECSHGKITTTVQYEHMPTAMFDMRYMESLALNPRCKSCAKIMSDYAIASYTWEGCENIKGIKEPMPIGSLHVMLRKLLHVRCRRYIWVDALCINQDSEEEKEYNITLMGHLYENAKICYACIGVKVRSGINSISRLLPFMELYTLYGGGYSQEEYPETASCEIAEDIDNITGCLSAIFKSRWFSRAWTVQESILSKNLFFVTDNVVIPKNDIELFADYALMLLNEDDYLALDEYHNAITSLAEYRELLQPSDICAMTVLKIMSKREATKEHDKVYSVLGILPNLDIQISYKMPLDELHRLFQVQLLKSGDHSVLLIVGKGFQDMKWACHLNNYQCIGYVSGACGYTYDHQDEENITKWKKGIFKHTEVQLDDGVNLNGYSCRIKDMYYVESITKRHLIEHTRRMDVDLIARHVDENGRLGDKDENTIATNIKSMEWLSATNRYFGYVKGHIMLMILSDVPIHPVECMYIRSDEEHKEHFWIVFRHNTKIGVGITYELRDSWSRKKICIDGCQ
jgi:hypothetical protein